MYCSHCGQELNDRAVVCTKCGCLVDGRQAVPQSKPSTDIMCIVGFVLSFFVTIAGLIVSILAYKRVKGTADRTGEMLAKAGIIISAVTIGLSVVAFIFVFTFWWLVLIGAALM